MTLALATYVRQHENQAGGLSWGQLLDWYLAAQAEDGGGGQVGVAGLSQDRGREGGKETL